ncbi:hypothetical protein [Nitratireductor sp. XY-223]|uniref:hypothetical protein n=1 Tax=Nitratireductor sp. XY-223 TaxID=2561926 RepID=UPI0010AB2CCC|nr:hypothetical protein [Nitratireductor sp. XY-223]
MTGKATDGMSGNARRRHLPFSMGMAMAAGHGRDARAQVVPADSQCTISQGGTVVNSDGNTGAERPRGDVTVVVDTTDGPGGQFSIDTTDGGGIKAESKLRVSGGNSNAWSAAVTVTAEGDIATKGTGAHGIHVWSTAVAAGGGSTTAGAVAVTHERGGTITTTGSGSDGILASSSGDGGSVTVDARGTIAARRHGIHAVTGNTVSDKGAVP